MPVITKPSRRLALAASTAALTIFGGHAAFAAADAAPADPNSATTVEEVVVTAQKRSENIQNVPASVSVVGSKQLEDFHVSQLTDIGAYVSGLQIDSGGTPGQTTISIRGIAPLSSGATVGTYIDETPIGATSIHDRGQFYALDILPYDVQRIEVLEGPQGTLYGANSLGGLLKYVLTTPSLDKAEVRMGGDLSGISGSGEAGGGVRAMINTPLVEGKVGFIASVASEKTPGYIDNVQTGEKDQNGTKQQSARFALLWQAADNVSVRLGALFQRVNADGNASVALDPGTLKPLFGDLTDNNFLPNTFDSSLQYYTADVNWDLGWAKLVSATSYSDQKTSVSQDSTRTYSPIYPAIGFDVPALSAFDLDLENKKFTQEVRLSSPSDKKLEWLVGAFYDYETGSNSQTVTAQNLDGSPIIGLNPSLVAGLPTTYKEYAFFGDLTYHLSDRFDVSGGVRFAQNEQKFREIISGGILAPLADVPGSSSEGVWTYSVSPRFHITKDIMTYVRVATGYQAGGPNTALPGVPPAVKSDTLTSYEVGLKSAFWNHRAILNLSAFNLDWNDIQVTGSLPGGITYVANGGTARSRGVEADATVRPIDSLLLQGTLAYTDAKLSEDVPSVGGLAGDRLPFIPVWSGSIRADYSWPVANDWYGHAGAGLRLVGNRFSSGPNSLVEYNTPGYSALDLNLSLSNSRWTVGLFAKNVTDKRAYLTAGAVQNGLTGEVPQVEGVVLQPRTIGIALDVRM